MSDEPLIAAFVDYENLELGVRDMKAGTLKIDLILKRLLEKGRLVYKRAYCDWSNHAKAVREFHGLGIELIDIPRSKMSGKNSADIHMVVDAVDLCYSKSHIDLFALLTGDSDFSPLASKLKENDKRVIGCGVKNSTSKLLVANCDEFIFYDDLLREEAPKRRKKADSDQDKAERAVDQLVSIVRSLDRDYDSIWGSMVKQTIRRVHPEFNELYAGFRSFGELLREAEKRKLIDLEMDESRGNFKVSLRQD
ncbi:MAG: NYN domain-containing protein [Myxococcota bacterium]|nr:NYN domain-containing protein [Myxococcota bacterium]